MQNFKYILRHFIDKNRWSNIYLGINKESNKKIILNILINVEGNEVNLEKFKNELNLIKNITNLTCRNYLVPYYVFF